MEPRLEKTNPKPTRRASWLAGALSIEYEPCSVAAAELADVAYSLTAYPKKELLYYDLRRKPNEQLQCATGHETLVNGIGRRIVANNLAAPTTQLCYLTGIKNNLPFSMMLNISEDRHVRTETVEEKRRLRSTTSQVVQTIEYTYASGDTWLAHDIAGGKVLLPIATFELRQDGSPRVKPVVPSLALCH